MQGGENEYAKRKRKSSTQFYALLLHIIIITKPIKKINFSPVHWEQCENCTASKSARRKSCADAIKVEVNKKELILPCFSIFIPSRSHVSFLNLTHVETWHQKERKTFGINYLWGRNWFFCVNFSFEDL